MTDTLLREFEEWLKDELHQRTTDDYWTALIKAKDKLEELKKKYKVG